MQQHTCDDCQYCLAEQYGQYVSYYCSAQTNLGVAVPYLLRVQLPDQTPACELFDQATEPCYPEERQTF